MFTAQLVNDLAPEASKQNSDKDAFATCKSNISEDSCYFLVVNVSNRVR